MGKSISRIEVGDTVVTDRKHIDEFIANLKSRKIKIGIFAYCQSN